MIKLRQPSVALHSHDVPSWLYDMHVASHLPKGASAHDVVNRILDAHDYAPGLYNVVLNAHGASGKIFAGGTSRLAIKRGNVDLFGALRGTEVLTIWVVACEVAKGDKGTEFCRSMARAAGCNVVASNMSQFGEWKCPFGCIDYYEGPVFRWDPSGNMSVCRSDGVGVPGVF